MTGLKRHWWDSPTSWLIFGSLASQFLNYALVLGRKLLSCWLSYKEKRATSSESAQSASFSRTAYVLYFSVCLSPSPPLLLPPEKASASILCLVLLTAPTSSAKSKQIIIQHSAAWKIFDTTRKKLLWNYYQIVLIYRYCNDIDPFEIINLQSSWTVSTRQ